ncbi:cytoplasmic glycerophosphodiester phosphodiesterase [compost metagenome]
MRLSKDLVPVVFHDDDLKRIVTREEKVAELTAAELKQYAKAPSLEDVLTSADLQIQFNIELKTDKAFDGTLEEKITEVVHRTRTEKRILFSSFNPLALYRLSKLLPNIPRALLATQEKHERNKVYLRRLWLAPFVNIHLLHLDSQFVTAEEVVKWKKRGVPVALWTVNDSTKAKEYLDAGALSIISDELSK